MEWLSGLLLPAALLTVMLATASFRADEHQQRRGVARLRNCREGELGERAGRETRQ